MKKVLSLMLAFAMIFAIVPMSALTASAESNDYYTTSATNYDKLYSHIEENSRISSNGEKYMSIPMTVTTKTYYLEFYLKDEGIKFLSLNENSGRTLKIFTSFILQKDSKYLSTNSYILFISNTNVDLANNDIIIDRSTYTNEKTYPLTNGGKYISASQISSLFNSNLDLIMMLFDKYLYSNLGFGLSGLGFVSYVGYGSAVCDSPSSYHTGATYLKNQKKATYYETGYTGDTYCKDCNVKLQSGTVIPKLTVSSVSVQTNPKKTTYYVGDSLNTSGLALKVKFSDNSTSTITSGFTVSGFSSASVGTKTLTVTFGGKTVKFNVKVINRNTSKPATPVLSSRLSTTVTLKKMKGYEYSKDGKIWQSSNVFTGLIANTNYTFYQRIAATATCDASAISSALKVRTNPKETLVKQNGIWYYTVNDKKMNATTLVKYGSTWYYVKGGKLSTDNTLVKYNGVWYHVKNGKLASDTTLVKYGNTWYYVKNGKMNTSNTLVNYKGVWYHVKGGKMVSDTTLVKYGNTWIYVKNGKKCTDNTLVKYGNSWYHVKNGTLVKDTTLVKYGSKWYYVQKGVVNFKANTKVKFGGKWYTIRNGVVK